MLRAGLGLGRRGLQRLTNTPSRGVTGSVSRVTESLFDRSNRPTTFAVLASVGIIAYNNLAVSAALPEVGNDLGNVALLPWTISVELLTSGVAILFAGPLVDGLGPRRVFRWSVSAFMVTSITCAAAPTMAWLILGRAFQGLAAGTLMTVVMSAIGLSFASDLRPRVFAATSTVWGVTSVAGPTIAASLVTVIGWRGIFAFNVPVAAFAALLAWRALPDRQPDTESVRIDMRGIALISVISTAALASVEGSIEVAAVAFAISGIGLVAYVRHANRAPQPVMRLHHLLHSRYRPIHLTSTLVIGAALGAFAFLPVYMRGARGTSSSLAAFSIVFHSVGWSLSAFAASRLQRRFRSETIIMVGASLAAPMLGLTTLAVAFDAPLPLIFFLLFGVGSTIGAVSTTGVATLQHRIPITEMGRINAAHQFMRTIGITYGVGLAGVVLFGTVDRRIGDVEAVRDLLGSDATGVDSSVADALAAGYSWTLLVCTAAMALAIPSAVHLVRTRVEPVPSAP